MWQCLALFIYLAHFRFSQSYGLQVAVGALGLGLKLRQDDLGDVIWDMGFPKMDGFWGKIMENPIKMDDFGIPLFQETPENLGNISFQG